MSDNSAEARKARLASFEARIDVLEETGQRLRDGQKLAFGALIGVAALLIAVAWYGGRKHQEALLAESITELEKRNSERLAEAVRNLQRTEAQLDDLLDRKIAVRWQELQIRLNSLNVGSATNFAQLNQDLTRKIALMGELMESRHGEAFGLTYFNQAIATLNRGLFAAATDYFLAAALAFWKGNDEGNVQTCLSRLNQYCFPRLRGRDFASRPAIDEKYLLLLREMEKADTGGRWQVAIKDLKQAMADARARK